jgi:hypothetical protein
MQKTATAIIISTPIVAKSVPACKKKLAGIKAVNPKGITKLLR